ncbi:hypothetical protein NS365_22225 [Aureimonas ureilytica]|uniref:Uncharacterized protein n=1 Tax=Aureimonas ureilytica TaxID=401562 RepID=A0A175REH5_9HYPH|nr:hypothetical protein [Aureimonas ureilytica]KTR02207.1 hypothetical protein NS365_22225 [Aureimonas ureilytica]
MASVLALATDADGRIRSNELGLPFPHLRFLLERWMKKGSIPLRDVVEGMLHTAGRDDDPEAVGRLAALIKAALGPNRDGPETIPAREDEKAALRGAAGRWVEARMRTRKKHREAKQSEPRLAAGLAAAAEVFCPLQPLRH